MTDKQRATLEYLRSVARETGGSVDFEQMNGEDLIVREDRGPEWDHETIVWSVDADGFAHIL
jgi:hypothetical protein